MQDNQYTTEAADQITTQEAVAEDVTEVAIDPVLLEEIYKINGKLIEGKLKFSDLQMKIEEFEEKKQSCEDKVVELQSDSVTLQEQAKVCKLQKAQLKTAIDTLSETFQSKLNEIASNYGIESNETVRWSFDFTAGKFIKVTK